MNEQKNIDIGKLAKKFMDIRYGSIVGYETEESKDWYLTKLGVVYDAYDELLNGELKKLLN